MNSYREVNFVPWVGIDYHRTGFRGRRLLIVGESHYTDWPDNDGEVRRHLLDPAFTATTVSHATITGEGAVTWRRVQEILEEEPTDDFWHQVAFYNFVQVPVEGGPGDRPTAAQGRVSLPAFFEVLNELKPERMYMFGKFTWDNTDVNRQPLQGETPDYPDGVYSIGPNQNCFAAFTRHPGSRHWASARSRADYIRKFVTEDKRL